MQVKGIVKLLFILFSLVVLLQFLYLLPTNKVENAAEKYAKEQADNAPKGTDKYEIEKLAKAEYLDSMSGEVIFKIPLIKEYTYDDLKKSQLALGLDLKGGMSVVLQVDLKEFLIALSNNNSDPTFRKAIENASKARTNTQTDFITLFYNEWTKIAEGKSLARIFLRNPSMRDVIKVNSSDAEVRAVIRQQADQTVGQTYDMLNQRIDKLGVTQPNVSLDEARDLILVELPGIDNPQRARNFLQASAKLEFWDVFHITDPGILEAFIEADKTLENLMKGDTSYVAVEEPEKFDTVYTPVLDSLGNVIDSTQEVVPAAKNPALSGGPLTKLLTLNLGTEGGMLPYPLTVMGVADQNKMKQINEYLEKPEIQALFPKEFGPRWSYKPVKDPETNKFTKQYMLYGIRKQSGTDDAPIEGDKVISASASPDPQSGQMMVNLRMNPTGAKKWAEMTTKAFEDSNREIAILLDDAVVSAPSVNSPITGGNSQITGSFTVAEADDFASILEIGKLPAKTTIIQESTVGPSLGAKNIQKSINAMLIGFFLVMAFMIVYYGGGGIISVIALLINVLFIFGALASFGTVLTLPGIAGIILTIGMAVDANAIIFERVKEELRAGKTMLASIKEGYLNSYSSIIDANVTTLLVAFVLAYFGLGPVKGFAVVLITGVLSSMFTAVLFSKLMVDTWTGRGKKISFWLPFTRNALSYINLDWIKMRIVAYSISGVIILAGLISLFTRGLDLGVDFQGGFSYTIEFDQNSEVDPQELRDGLKKYLESAPVVKAVDAQNTFTVVTNYLINDKSEGTMEKVTQKMFDGLSSMYQGMEYANFIKEDAPSGVHIVSSTQVGPTIAEDILSSAYWAVILSLIVIFVYVLIRFSKWQFSFAAVVALFHDTLIIIGSFSLLKGIVPFSLEIDQAFIAAILTIIGYSINDTVIVFDRIRENIAKHTTMDRDSLLNNAINSTLSRTLITSGTTFFVILALFVFGGSSIKGFSFALLVGIVVGTYSSIFIATPIVRDMVKELHGKKQVKKSFSKAADKA
jgi:SecD/SecF fusion protein